MDLKRFEKIESKERALILIAQGEKLYDHNHNEFYYDAKKECVIRHVYCGSPQKTNITINNFLDKLFYLKKPFDVRQAMRENPGEWVGKFKSDEGHWMAVGFDTKHFNALTRYLNQHVPVESEIPGTGFPSPEDLDACIPIDEVTK